MNSGFFRADYLIDVSGLPIVNSTFYEYNIYDISKNGLLKVLILMVGNVSTSSEKSNLDYTGSKISALNLNLLYLNVIDQTKTVNDDTYYVIIKASNDNGQIYGNEIELKVL